MIANGGNSGPTSPLQVVPQSLTSPNNIHASNKTGTNPKGSGTSGIQELQIPQGPKPILINGQATTTTFCTPTGVSNTNTKKIILQPLAQPSNIILTSGGQQILLQATNQGKSI